MSEMTVGAALDLLWKRHEQGVEKGEDGKWRCSCGAPLPCQDAVALTALGAAMTAPTPAPILTPELLDALAAHVRARAKWRCLLDQAYERDQSTNDQWAEIERAQHADVQAWRAYEQGMLAAHRAELARLASENAQSNGKMAANG